VSFIAQKAGIFPPIDTYMKKKRDKTYFGWHQCLEDNFGNNMNDLEELVDILNPLDLTKTGQVKYKFEAHINGDWLGSFNLWVVQRYPIQAILYQQRSFDAKWAPGLIDVTVGGHYRAGENIKDGLREVEEEIGKKYSFESLVYLGKKMYVGNYENNKFRYIVDVFLREDNSNINSFRLQYDELEGLVICPISALIALYEGDVDSFISKGVRYDNRKLIASDFEITRDSFPNNPDDYHKRMVMLIKRYFDGEKGLYYG